MNKRIALLIAAAALAAMPAAANDSVSVTVTGTIAPRCELGARVRQIADVNSTSVAIGYSTSGEATGVTFASSQVNLGTTAPQLMADLTTTCNTGSATLSLTSDNGFKLLNPAVAPTNLIAYSVNLVGQGGASGISSNYTTVLTGTGPARAAGRRLQFVLPAVVNPVNIAAGTYSDTIRITVTPNP